MKEIFNWGCTIDDAVRALDLAKKYGLDHYIVFQGEKIYPGITLDEAYLKFTGYNYKTFMKRLEASRRGEPIEDNEEEEIIKEEPQEKPVEDNPYSKYGDALDGMSEEDKKLLTEFMMRGEQIIFPERYDDWEEYVIGQMNLGTHGHALKHVVKILEALEAGANKETVEKLLLEASRETEVLYFVINRIAQFTSVPLGVDIVEEHYTKYLCEGTLSPALERMLNNERREIEEFSKNKSKQEVLSNKN